MIFNNSSANTDRMKSLLPIKRYESECWARLLYHDVSDIISVSEESMLVYLSRSRLSLRG